MSAQRSPWPMAQLRDGRTADVRYVRGPEAHTHDDVYLADLSDGWVAVSNPRLDLTRSLREPRRHCQ